MNDRHPVGFMLLAVQGVISQYKWPHYCFQVYDSLLMMTLLFTITQHLPSPQRATRLLYLEQSAVYEEPETSRKLSKQKRLFKTEEITILSE